VCFSFVRGEQMSKGNEVKLEEVQKEQENIFSISVRYNYFLKYLAEIPKRILRIANIKCEIKMPLRKGITFSKKSA
jgi:hypothetical protein